MKAIILLMAFLGIQAQASNPAGENCVARTVVIDQHFQQVEKVTPVDALAQVSRGVVTQVSQTATSCKVYVQGAQVENTPGILGRLCKGEIADADLVQSGVETVLNFNGECQYQPGQAFSGMVFTKDGHNFLE